MNAQAQNRFNYILVGGGLQSGLLVLALQHYHPTARILLLERNDRLAGNHTWSFHLTDIPDAATSWASPLPVTRWNGYRVCFPGFHRDVAIPYASLHSSALHDLLCQRLPQSPDAGDDNRKRPGFLRTDASAALISSQHVVTSDGLHYSADLVLDCRGRCSPAGEHDSRAGYQKFVGLEIELESDWPDALPTLMDGRVRQSDGFRFLYTLPFTRRRVLVEDTRFSNTASLDVRAIESDIAAYIADRSGARWKTVRQESGCLPMPWSGTLKPRMMNPLSGGYAGGWFHAATGYSFPLAVRFADAVASGSPDSAGDRVRRLARDNRFQASFSRLLNRLLFQLVQPGNRWQIFRRFYRSLSTGAIQRFYAHEFTRRDAVRMIVGTPPRGLDPVQFVHSFRAPACPVTPQ